METWALYKGYLRIDLMVILGKFPSNIVMKTQGFVK